MALSQPHPFTVSQTFLAHAVLAHSSSEVSTLDLILTLQSRCHLKIIDADRKTTLASLPPEVLLIVRSFLLPAVTDALIAETTAAYADSLLSRARHLCTECLAYNVRVYGYDTLVWPKARPGMQQADSDGQQSCSCGLGSTQHSLSVANWHEWARSTEPVLGAHKDHFEHRGGKRGHKRQHSYSAESASWLDDYLTRRAARGIPIRDVIADVLASDFGVQLVQQSASQPSSSNADVSDAVALVAEPSQSLSPCFSAGAADRLIIVARELALSASPTAGSEVLTTARDMAAAFVAESVASASSAPVTKTPAAVVSRASSSSLGAIVGAGIALGAYALARLGVF